MRKYNAPEIEIVAFRAEDIVTTSGGGQTPSPSGWTTNDASNPAVYSGALNKFNGGIE